MRKFNIGLQSGTFDTDFFRRWLRVKKEADGTSNRQRYMAIGDALGFSEETVKGWASGKSGPCDKETIEKLAEIMDVNAENLIKGEVIDMVCLSERQKNAAKKIYDVCVQFLEGFLHSDGFNDYWFDHVDEDSNKAIENAILEDIEQQVRKIWCVFNQEYFDLHDTEIYSDFYDYIDSLSEIYDAKISYAYRFENPDDSVNADYEKAYKQLNAIIVRYC